MSYIVSVRGSVKAQYANWIIRTVVCYHNLDNFYDQWNKKKKNDLNVKIQITKII